MLVVALVLPLELVLLDFAVEDDELDLLLDAVLDDVFTLLFEDKAFITFALSLFWVFLESVLVILFSAITGFSAVVLVWFSIIFSDVVILLIPQ